MYKGFAMKMKEKPEEKVWQEFQTKSGVTDQQLAQFQKYAHLLLEWNEKHNLTAIDNLGGVVNQHFLDSLALRKFQDLEAITTLADVGPGAGFPALPLKILYPHLKIILIEVTYKKQVFLQEVVDLLELDNVEIAPLDWRTFLRTTEGEIDLFVSRAALDEMELTRMFRSTSAYKTKTMVYWASNTWECAEKVKEYLKKEETYEIKNKVRKLVFFHI
jgi:16S rRNA (guanine(527)-N(7))-methyltransferase RsmG